MDLNKLVHEFNIEQLKIYRDRQASFYNDVSIRDHLENKAWGDFIIIKRGESPKVDS